MAADDGADSLPASLYVAVAIEAARLQDYLLTIGLSAAIAVIYFVTLRSPERNAVTRLVSRYTAFWSRFPLTPPSRAQMWIMVVLFSLIALGTTVAFFVTALHGQLR